jgi:hypothetical protein
MGTSDEWSMIALDDTAGRSIAVRAGSRGVWRITYQAGDRGLAPGGGIRIVRETHKFWLGLVKQTDDPGGEDYCAAGSDGPPVELRDVPLFYKRLKTARLIVGEPGLRPGGRLWFTCGTATFPAAVPPFAQRRCVFWVDVDYSGDEQYQRLPEPLIVSIMPGPAAKATLVAPSVVAPGETFALRVRFEDGNSNPRAAYTGRARFACKGARATLAGNYEFSGADDGWRVFGNCVLQSEGVFRITMHAEGLPTTVSNPVLCQVGSERRVYWGDMHNHTEWCDGTDTVAWVYEFGRDQAFLDVCACTEHIGTAPPDWSIPVIDKSPASAAALWQEQMRQAQAYHDPGRFVTFLGYEFSPFGDQRAHPENADHCVWFLDDQHPLVMDADIEELGRKLAETKALLAAHVGGRYARWNYEVPAEVMPVVEIASMHEHSEWFAQQALKKGLVVGFVGMSDGHMGRPGYDLWARHGRSELHKRAYSPQSAITAFLSPSLERGSIWQAMRSRSVYATTGARLLLDFSCQGVPMGGEVSVEGALQFRACVHGTAPIDRVQIIRGDRLAHSIELAPSVTGEEEVWDAAFEWEDPQPVHGKMYYYLRVTQCDSHFAWSSPIWVTCSQGLAPEHVNLPPWNSDVWPPARREDHDYLPEIRAHLTQQRCGERFVELEQVGVFEETRGRYALVRCRDAERENRPTHIHYYLGFEDERLYVSAGWADYGQLSND